MGLLLLLTLTAIGCRGSAEWRGLRKIGVIAPFSGYDGGTAMAMLAGVRAAVAERNARGGVRGVRLEVVSLDDLNDPAVAADRVAELARDPDVSVTIVRLGGDDDRAVQAFRESGLPALAIGGPLALAAADPIKAVCAGAMAEGEGAAVAARGAVKPLLVTQAGGGFSAAGDAFAHTLGDKVERFTVPSSNRTSLSDASVRAAGAHDFVYFSGPYLSGVELSKALGSLGSNAKILLGTDADTSAVALIAGRGIDRLRGCPNPSSGSDDSAARRGLRDRGATALLAYDVTESLILTLDGVDLAIGRYGIAARLAEVTERFHPTVAVVHE